MICPQIFATALIMTLAALPAAAGESGQKQVREGGMSQPAQTRQSESATDAMRRYIIELRGAPKKAPGENMDHVVGEELC